MIGRVHLLASGHRVLIDVPTDFQMQALQTGHLGLDATHLCFAQGSDITPVVLPSGTVITEEPDGPVFTMLGGSYRLGDHIECGGGGLATDSSVPPDAQLTVGTIVTYLQ